jgi:single-stranded-DNA-specific exonuclease
MIQRRIASTPPQQLPGIPDLLATVYANRGVQDVEDVNHHLSGLLPVLSLAHVEHAASLLDDCILAKNRIVIVADFDADGATSCALMVDFLRKAGADVSYKVPDRVRHGYGLSVAIVKEVLETLSPTLIMTVDNGISNVEGVAYAKQAGCTVLISDHHLAPETLPDADVIVNPNQPGDDFASKNLAGVGVTFYIVCALYHRLCERGAPPNAKPAEYLDLVALGTVADVVRLDKNNRILVANGLRRIQKRAARPGVYALFEVAGRDAHTAQTSDIGFGIGPRINAAGRMEDMAVGIACLLAPSDASARRLALLLDGINRERKAVQAQMQEEAEDILASIDMQDLPYGICLYDARWHEGVVGIVAGRLKERFHRPVIVFAKGSDGLKGSARSIPGMNIRDCLADIDRLHPGMIVRFGGHAAAAGLTLDEAHFDEFCQAFDTGVRQLLQAEDLEQMILTDAALDTDEFSLSLAQTLRHAAPWGQGFPEPVFDGRFVVQSVRVLQDKHLKLQVSPQNSALRLDAIWFNFEPEQQPDVEHVVQLAYQLDVNTYQGNQSLQLRVAALHIETPS